MGVSHYSVISGVLNRFAKGEPTAGPSRLSAAILLEKEFDVCNPPFGLNIEPAFLACSNVLALLPRNTLLLFSPRAPRRGAAGIWPEPNLPAVNARGSKDFRRF